MKCYSSKSQTALLILLTLLTSISAARTTNTAFIKTSCSTTSYPTLCYTSLSVHASTIQQNPRLLAHAALSVSLDTARSTSSEIVKLSRAAGMKPREVGAMRDCMEELSDSVDQIQRSMGEINQIKGSNFGMKMSDIQTWVSAALTDEDTCTDGFAGKFMNGGVKTAVRAKILNVAHMTINALGLINSYASLHGLNNLVISFAGLSFSSYYFDKYFN